LRLLRSGCGSQSGADQAGFKIPDALHRDAEILLGRAPDRLGQHRGPRHALFAWRGGRRLPESEPFTMLAVIPLIPSDAFLATDTAIGLIPAGLWFTPLICAFALSA